MHQKHLAIASVPCQEWGELYIPTKALNRGTIFPDLDKPFFATEQTELPNINTDCHDAEHEKKEHLLQEINTISFLVNDLSLYLDTHCEDTNALREFESAIKERKRLLTEFAQQFYPLTQNCMADTECHHCFSWTEGPMPWEGVCI